MTKTKQGKISKPARRSVQRMVMPLPARLHQIGVQALAEARGEPISVTWDRLDACQQAGWRAVADYVTRHNH